MVDVCKQTILDLTIKKVISYNDFPTNFDDTNKTKKHL